VRVRQRCGVCFLLKKVDFLCDGTTEEEKKGSATSTNSINRRARRQQAQSAISRFRACDTRQSEQHVGTASSKTATRLAGCSHDCWLPSAWSVRRPPSRDAARPPRDRDGTPGNPHEHVVIQEVNPLVKICW